MVLMKLYLFSIVVLLTKADERSRLKNDIVTDIKKDIDRLVGHMKDELKDDLKKQLTVVKHDLEEGFKERMGAVRRSVLPLSKSVDWLSKFHTECKFPHTGQHCDARSQAISYKKKSVDHSPSDVGPLVNANTVTVCAWFNGHPENYSYYFSLYATNGPRCNTFQLWDNRGTLAIGLKDKDYDFSYLKGVYKPWVHICTAWGNNQVKLYADGKLNGLINTDAVTINVDQVVIGNDVDHINNKCVVNDASQSFIGDIAQFYIWGRQLSDVDIEMTYRGKMVEGSIKRWDAMLDFRNTDSIQKREITEFACEEQNIDFYGSGIKTIDGVPSWMACGLHCRSLVGCLSWSWASPLYHVIGVRNQCFLKSKANIRKEVNLNVISGLRNCGAVSLASGLQ